MVFSLARFEFGSTNKFLKSIFKAAIVGRLKRNIAITLMNDFKI